jgi:serine phosphatase RsbU (regulator of sigma subunit)
VIEIKGELIVDSERWLDSERAKKRESVSLLCEPLTTSHQPLTTAPLPCYWLSIGDVSGHGVPAGLVMMMVQSTIRLALRILPHETPKNILQYVNKIIYDNIKKLGEEKYMTITLMSVYADGLIYYSGLHQDIMVYRAASQQVELVETQGMWIGILDKIEGMMAVDQLQLQPEDVLLLYTDGITEALDIHDQQFSETKLQQVFQNLGSHSPQQILQGILNSLTGFNCIDDITLIIMKRDRDQ